MLFDPRFRPTRSLLARVVGWSAWVAPGKGGLGGLSLGIVRVEKMAMNGMMKTPNRPDGVREHLSSLSRASNDRLISTDVAAEVWGISRSTATSRLHRLLKGGWLLQVRRGLFY